MTPGSWMEAEVMEGPGNAFTKGDRCEIKISSNLSAAPASNDVARGGPAPPARHVLELSSARMEDITSRCRTSTIARS